MKEKILLNFLKYYRNSLADGERLDITKKDYEKGFFFDNIYKLKKEKLSDTYKKLYKINYIEDRKKEKDEKKEPISIFISPFFIATEYKHFVRKKNQEKVYPYWIPCVLTEEGNLLPPMDENIFPWFVRRVLEPTSTKTSDFPIIGSVDKIDSVLNTFEWSFNNWLEYLEQSELFFQEVTGFLFDDFKVAGFIKKSVTCIIKAKDFIPAINVIKLYDSIIENSIKSSLLENFLCIDEKSRTDIPKTSDFFLEKGHYGQYGNQFSLSNSQRKTLLIFEQQTEGKVLAVNGPPGTGKTTLLQSIVANELVKSVINGEKPPRLVAVSTNNQAITNILDSFGTSNNVVSWIPNLSSLGTYMISNSIKKQEEAVKKGYQLLVKSGGKLSGKYFSDFHSVDIVEIEDSFLSRQNIVRKKNESISNVIFELKNKVIEITKKIDNYLEITKKANSVEDKYFSFAELPDKKDEIEHLSVKLENEKNKFNELLIFRDNLENFLSKNKILTFLRFIPYFNNILVSKIGLFLVNAPFDSIKKITNQQKIRNELIAEFDRTNISIENINKLIIEKTKIYSDVLNVKTSWDNILIHLTQMWNKYLSKLTNKKSVADEYNKADRVEKINMILDISLRYEAFIYSKYYWEAKWIEKRKDEDGKSEECMLRPKELEYISYLTPLFISTFHTLPSYCSYKKDISGDKAFIPLYDFFDLLIVDEAGQVSPEIAVPSFSLAKKALVVGDIHQIEPVWNIAYKNIDKGNLKEAGLLENNTFENLKNKGVLCSSGSLMKLAQNASDFSTNKTLNGTFLSEHRRCVDEIVAFSNKYIYNNLLIPKVGSGNGVVFDTDKGSTNKIMLPPLSYINISAKSETKNSSIYNTKEATAIAKWLSNYKEHILNTVNKEKPKDKIKELKDIIGIVTPFAAQRDEIIKQFKKHDIDTQITVGTVHALQGAEREIIIFSPTYGINHFGNIFFNYNYNMLNVALTRAKKHFIVIGNMRLFNPLIDSPAGNLAKFLFLKQENELSSSFFYESLNIIESKDRINKLSLHVEALKKAFDIAKKRLIIVSPFLSINAINADNLIINIKNAVDRGVEIKVFTDKNLDIINGKLKNQAKEAREMLVNNGVKLTVLNGIHNKAIAIDDKILIEGSFNWLSAVRDLNSPFLRYEVSQVIKGTEAPIQINELVSDLDKFVN